MASLGWVFFNIGKINFYLFVIYNVRIHQKYQKYTFLMVLNVSYQGEIVFRKKNVYWIYLADTNNLSQKTEYFPFLTKTWKKSAFWWSYTVRRYSFFVFFSIFMVLGVCGRGDLFVFNIKNTDFASSNGHRADPARVQIRQKSAPDNRT